MRTFQAPAILKVGSPTSDGGMNIRLTTNEISNQEKVDLMEYNGTFGYVLFRANAFDDSEIPKDDATDDQKKPSQRLRSVLFLRWKALNNGDTFDTYYRRQMEAIINKVKETLD